jgi:hypothetical protein
MTTTKKQRNLDGVYFRVKRDGKWIPVCYSDLTQGERDGIAARRARNATPEQQAQWWRSLADILADQLYDIGEQFGIEGE